MLRGYDATGVITCHSNGDFGIMKEACEASYFVPQFVNCDLDKDLWKNGSAVIGHNRAKTVGENSDKNAHPFVVDKTFAMVHNGTLRNHKAMHDTTVDSEALAIVFKRAMDEEDFRMAVSKAVWEIQGAFACVWYDQKRHQVGMIRNSQRPLSILETQDSVVFGSELLMLNWIAQRNHQKPIAHQSIKEEVLYLFDLKKGGGAMEEIPLEKKPTPIYTATTTRTTTWPGGGRGTTPATGATAGVSTSRTFPSRNKDAEKCSKNAAKRFKKNLVGKHITFTLNDWIERDWPKENGTEFIILGDCFDTHADLALVQHDTKCIVDIAKVGMSIKEMDFQTEWLGVVSDVEYDARGGKCTLTLTNVLPVMEDVKDDGTTTVH